MWKEWWQGEDDHSGASTEAVRQLKKNLLQFLLQNWKLANFLSQLLNILYLKYLFQLQIL